MAFQTKVCCVMAVNDLPASKLFFEKLGWHVNPTFNNEDLAAIVISDTVSVMLHTMPSIRRFTKLEIADPKKTVEMQISLEVESKEEVNRIVNAAVAGGGDESEPADDYGFIYQRSFEDLDGHHWSVAWMNPEQPMPPMPPMSQQG